MKNGVLGMGGLWPREGNVGALVDSLIVCIIIIWRKGREKPPDGVCRGGAQQQSRLP